MDKYTVKLMPHALRDLEEIYEYIAQHLQAASTAENLITQIENGILSLEYMPNRCPARRIGSYANKGYRQLFIKNYTVVFRVNEESKTVIVVTVRYSSSQF